MEKFSVSKLTLQKIAGKTLVSKNYLSIFYFFYIQVLALAAIISRTLTVQDNQIIMNFEFISDDGFLYLYTAEQIKKSSNYDIENTLSKIFPNKSVSEISTGDQIIGFSRPLYPYLLKLFNINSAFKMLIIPAIAFILLLNILYFTLKKNLKTSQVLFILTLFAGSKYIRLNLISTTTEVIACLFFTIHLIILLKRKNFFTFTLGVFCVVACNLARPMFLSLIVIWIVIMYFERSKIDWYFGLISSTMTIIVFTIIFVKLEIDSFAAWTVINNYFDTLSLSFASNSIKNLLLEFIYLYILDIPLLILLYFTTVSVFSKTKLFKALYLVILVSCIFSSSFSEGAKGMRFYLPFIIFNIFIVHKTTLKIPTLKSNKKAKL